MTSIAATSTNSAQRQVLAQLASALANVATVDLVVVASLLSAS